MPGTNNFQQFDPPGTNMESDAAYTADSTRTGGITFNQTMASLLANKILYQLSTGMAALMQAMANKGYNVSDASLSTLAAVMGNIQTTADGPVRRYSTPGVATTGAGQTVFTFTVPAGIMKVGSTFVLELMYAGATNSQMLVNFDGTLFGVGGGAPVAAPAYFRLSGFVLSLTTIVGYMQGSSNNSLFTISTTSPQTVNDVSTNPLIITGTQYNSFNISVPYGFWLTVVP